MDSIDTRLDRAGGDDVRNGFDDLDIREDSEGWNDVNDQDDVEDVSIKCLLCDQHFPSLSPLLDHQKSEHNFDLVATKQKFELEFYDLIKLINYIRSSSAANGDRLPPVSHPELWADDKFLQPVIEDDALLFCLDDLDSDQVDEVADRHATLDSDNKTGNIDGRKGPATSDAERIRELEAQLAQTTAQFERYRDQVADTLDARWTASSRPEINGGPSITQAQAKPMLPTDEEKLTIRYDEGYFESYGTLGIHHQMLADTVRTDAYRDFIYENKALFAGKVVLDVGCGTGILSMFAAKAGAKKVVAVDNSSIIDRARQIAYENGLGEVVSFHRGKVEDIDDQTALRLGLMQKGDHGANVPAVDIVVSEWMGYCLLFEAMLPSVLWARDRFLKRSAAAPSSTATNVSEMAFDGVMAPSHCSIHVAPLSDAKFIEDNVDFWRDVYGFDYSCLVREAIEDAFVMMPKADAIIGRNVTPGSESVKTTEGKTNPSMEVKAFDLYDTQVEDLSFVAPFSVVVDRDVPEGLDAWCIWFDIVFSPNLPQRVGKSAQETTANMSKLASDSGAVHFTTSPFGKATHWQTGICVIDRRSEGDKPVEPAELKRGDVIEGKLEFKKGREGRDLEIEMHWKSLRDGREGKEQGKQVWLMR